VVQNTNILDTRKRTATDTDCETHGGRRRSTTTANWHQDPARSVTAPATPRLRHARPSSRYQRAIKISKGTWRDVCDKLRRTIRGTPPRRPIAPGRRGQHACQCRCQDHPPSLRHNRHPV